MAPGESYKVGWVIPGRLGGLTHYTSSVSQEEIRQVMAEATALLDSTMQPVHFIINNRIMAMDFTVSLDQMVQAAPFLSNPLLYTLIVIVPEKLNVDAASIPVEKQGQLIYKHVNTVDEAFAFLKAQDSGLNWREADTAFFG